MYTNFGWPSKFSGEALNLMFSVSGNEHTVHEFSTEIRIKSVQKMNAFLWHSPTLLFRNKRRRGGRTDTFRKKYEHFKLLSHSSKNMHLHIFIVEKRYCIIHRQEFQCLKYHEHSYHCVNYCVYNVNADIAILNTYTNPNCTVTKAIRPPITATV